MQSTTAEGLVIDGTGDARLMSAGFKFKLDKHFAGNGSYVLTHVEHKAKQRGLYAGDRKAEPFQSAMSMLNFYINRAGKNLPDERREVLEKAKDELRAAFGREKQD